MHSNTYCLGSGNIALDNKADDLMMNITFLSNERVHHFRFPCFSNIDYNGIDESDLIDHIKELEKVHKEAEHLHHRAHPYVLEHAGYEDRFIIRHNTPCGTDQNDNAPITGGCTPLKALQHAWELWSIPPVLILNAEYYCPGTTIDDVYREVEL